MVIELEKDQQHCTLSVQSDLFGNVIFVQIATRKLATGKIGVWRKTVSFNEELEAKLFLFDVEVKYRKRGYI